MTRVIAHVRSNVIAYLALFVALGGTSYAAVAISNHSITPVKFNRGIIGGYVRGWVEVSASGRLVASGGRWQVSMDPESPGHYGITWKSFPNSRCTAVGSVDVPPTSTAQPGYLVSGTGSFHHREFTVVFTYNASGEQAPMPFNLALVCTTPR